MNSQSIAIMCLFLQGVAESLYYYPLIPSKGTIDFSKSYLNCCSTVNYKLLQKWSFLTM